MTFEVSLDQYRSILTNCGGMMFHRQENGKFFIKVCDKRYLSYVNQFINGHVHR